MRLEVFGRHSARYIAQVRAWAKRLDATMGYLFADGTVDLECPDGNICRNYKPTLKELIGDEGR